MLLSMTGYGRVEKEFKHKTIVVEFRSLNSKYTDIRFKTPQNYRNVEPQLRKTILQQIERGKVDVTIEVNSGSGSEEYALNKEMFKKYFHELKSLSKELDFSASNGDFIQSILRLPNVISAAEDQMDEEEWGCLQDVVQQTIARFINFRKAEGQAMENEARDRIKSITDLLQELPALEDVRTDRMRKKLQQMMAEFVNDEKVDQNRFEQEVLYYLEKIDITEEKVRLEQHCSYFLEVLDAKETLKGRKLSFISQEMGREINTLGAKAYSSDIQRVVVKMKDDLEKIKELLANTV